MKRCCCALLLSLLFLPALLQAENVKLHGVVTDVESHEVLPGAIISETGAHKAATVTDAKGRFALAVNADATGKVTVTVSCMGYKTVKTTIAANGKAGINADVALSKGNELKEVTVYAPRYNLGVKASQMSAIALNGEQIKKIPALFGEPDVMKALQRLPGVQTSGDGTAGIYVRGGEYDQNLITLDGSTLYNSEHLRGFISAINPDMVDNIVFYKGAFPARYGARLSSVVDVGIRNGDFTSYHGELNLGMLSSRLRVEGPLIKNRTSFVLSGRASYFNWIAQPVLEKIYDKSQALDSYTNMNFYDINAKIVHLLNENDKLSAVFYMGNDHNNMSPSSSSQQYSYFMSEKDGVHTFNRNTTSKYATDNSWGNIVSSIYWTHGYNDRLTSNVNLSYSQYVYKLRFASNVGNSSVRTDFGKTADKKKLYYEYKEDSYSTYHSEIKDAAMTADFHYRANEKNDVRFGIKGSFQSLNPTVDAYKDAHTYIYNSDYNENLAATMNEYDTIYQQVDTVQGKIQNVKTIALYIEDDFALMHQLKANIGLRYQLYAVTGKAYHSIEPRLSLRWLMSDAMSVKMSYSRMSQGIHLLSSSNLAMPSDLWVPITDAIPLMKSDQYALGYNWQITSGMELSIEGYYKTVNNVLEYKNGVSYMAGKGAWDKLVSMGKGRSYGVELFLQKKIGASTGWISYTWSKSLRTFDRPGEELNGGEEYYALNDRRHNLSIVFMQQLGQHWNISASWTYQTGRRGTIPLFDIYSPSLDFHDPISDWSASSFYHYIRQDMYKYSDSEVTYFKDFLQTYTYRTRNDYRLPAVHHLDVTVTYSVKHRFGESSIGLSVYNVYNRMNVTNVYIGYNKNKTVLKGMCPFPIMPTLSYTFKF